jgi:hypothetical protein
MSTKPARPPTDPAKALVSPSADVEPPSRNQPVPSFANVRGIIDALMQGSLVELFQAYGVAVAPLPRDARGESERPVDSCAMIAFTSASDGKCPNASGRLTLSIPDEVLDSMQRDPAHPARHADWSRELINQLMGRFKVRLLPFGAKLQAGLPSSLPRDTFETQQALTGSRRVYRARTLRGEVVATLEGTLKESELSYVGPKAGALEGELILF